MNGETPLYLAVQAAVERTVISEKVEDLKVVKLLLERGGNVDTSTYTGITPLQEASRKGMYLHGEVAARLGCCC